MHLPLVEAAWELDGWSVPKSVRAVEKGGDEGASSEAWPMAVEAGLAFACVSTEVIESGRMECGRTASVQEHASEER